MMCAFALAALGVVVLGTLDVLANALAPKENAMPHDFLSVYPAKAMEYLLAVSYLLLFVPFWR